MGSIKSDKSCALCKKPSEFVCEICNELYCSAECQDIDWRKHKYYCSPKPKLISLAEREGKISQSSRPVSSPRALSAIPQDEDVVSEVKSEDETWKSFMEPSNKEIKVVFNTVESNNNITRAWVCEIDADEIFPKFLHEMNEGFKKDPPSVLEHIAPGILVVVLNDGDYQRAVITKINRQNRQAQVRLIDAGNTMCSPFDKIMVPAPWLYSVPAFAIELVFNVSLDSSLTNNIHNVQIIEKIDEGSYKAEMKSVGKACSLLPISQLLENTAVNIVKLLDDGKTAIMKLYDCNGYLEAMQTVLNEAKNDEYFLSGNLCIGNCVAALADDGLWVRGRIICVDDEEKSGMVYDLDSGLYKGATKFKKVPSDFVKKPFLAFGIRAKEDLVALEVTGKKLSFILPSDSDLTANTINGLLCIEDNAKIALNVTASLFTGSPKELGLEQIEAPILNKAEVIITQVTTHNDFNVSLSFTKNYAKYFNEVGRRAPGLALSNLNEGAIVMYTPDKENFYRVSIKKLLPSNGCVVYNIDSGEEIVLKDFANHLRASHNAIYFAPVSLKQIKFKILDQLPFTCLKNKAFTLLNEHKTKGTPFRYVLNENDCELFDKDDKPLSLTLMPLIFQPSEPEVKTKPDINKPEKKMESPSLSPIKPQSTAAQKSQVREDKNTSTTLRDETVTFSKTQSKKSVSISVPDTSKDSSKEDSKFYINDLPVVPLKTGAKIAIKILDVSQIEQGYFTASDEGNVEADLAAQEQMQKLNIHYKKLAAAGKSGYRPVEGELCVALFDFDKNWHRCLCAEVISTTEFRLMFVDFGNVTKIKSENIQPITKEWMFPTLANICLIKDFKGTSSIERLVGALEDGESKLVCLVAKIEDGTYSIKV